MSPLTGIIPESARKKVYAIYTVVGFLIGATQAGLAAVPNVSAPTWLTVVLAVYAYAGIVVGATAASNTDVSE